MNKKFKLIVAMSNNRGIGYNNKLPWNFKEDLKHFSKLTKGSGNNAIIMGKNTWLSLNSKPLPCRDNLILSSSLELEYLKNNTDNIDNNTDNMNNNLYFFNNMDNLLSFCNNSTYNDIWVIGGSSIYEQFLNQDLIDECFITCIDKIYECDTFFPPLSCKWKLDNLQFLKTTTPTNIWIHNYKLI